MSGIFDLTGKKAVVTGGSAGIGLGMAKGLAEAGAQVAIWGRSQDKLDRAVKELANLGLTVHPQQVDVSQEQQVVDGFGKANELLGGLNTVVVNAGIGAGQARLVDTTTEQYKRVLDTNLDGAFWTIREGAKYMKANSEAGNPGGSIIGISSLGAVDGSPSNYAYAASKASMIAFVKSAAVELARYGVRVNAVLPGWIATDMTERLHDSEIFQDRVISRVPARRWGKPEDFAGIAVYLASDSSTYQTGTSTLVDGGYAIF
ncbi:NAD(P)-dependent dehydrogenase (short-subunit alcohol dehydrogenase family) [Antricoccus suffuscus]|uniref:NAD(P)-dependent dehydrogenase (Short-subunit alcohol dehydrogenase family) n=1 Tax=Antricoccus suffuscus TaxID=1629062 RepID=A0A2T0ZQN1_9ACTN|nr:SDR family NAD(P)-dependent oxidoreductase [Antricoccus suffuscus]PRZ38625.1 NAD(P)-dependent dehydrogenase (short-subunit alcohol dehydrogenase family) [Antricoccus suffuscus]